MIHFELRTIPADHAATHTRFLKNRIEDSLSTKLGPKAEAGRTRSEAGYQQIAAITCGRIARAIGCNEDNAAMLSMAVGMCFPKYGHAGLTAIKQYIIDREIDLDVESLEFTTICYYISAHVLGTRTGIITSLIYDLLQDYCQGTDHYMESKIVRLVQGVIMDIKKAEPFYDGAPGDLLFYATDELVELAKKHGVLTKGTLLDPYQNQIASNPLPSLTEAEQRAVYDRLDDLINQVTNHLITLLHCNPTPEETVLEYIVSGVLF